jgi:hypothetical protein
MGKSPPPSVLPATSSSLASTLSPELVLPVPGYVSTDGFLIEFLFLILLFKNCGKIYRKPTL